MTSHRGGDIKYYRDPFSDGGWNYDHFDRVTHFVVFRKKVAKYIEANPFWFGVCFDRAKHFPGHWLTCGNNAWKI